MPDEKSRDKPGGLPPLAYFQNFRRHLVTAVAQQETTADWKRPTLQKNRLYDPSIWNILSQDQHFFFTLLDQVLEQTPCPTGMKPTVILTKFGQKLQDILVLQDFVNLHHVLRASVHSACEVSSSNESVNLFWSRLGIQEVVGYRGNTHTALSIRETLNFQSNLDGRGMDVSPELMNICKYPQKSTFLQLYANTPHTKLLTWRSHPASGEIVSCGIMHPKTTAALDKAGLAYVRHMNDLVNKLKCVVSARIEVVTVLHQQDLIHGLDAKELLSEEAIRALLVNKPMLLPFAARRVPYAPSFINIMQDIGHMLVASLIAVRQKSRYQGHFIDTWKAFQLELALEFFFWGQPVYHGDATFAINLGPSVTDERSFTWGRGILGLTPPNSCCVPDSPPPLKIWTGDTSQQARIQRLFGFSDILQASAAIVGRRLCRIILEDLMGANTSMEPLTRDLPPGRSVGAISARQLVDSLEKADRFNYPATFPRAVILLRAQGRDLQDILHAGLASLNLRYFPAFRVSQLPTGGGRKLICNKYEFWRIIHADTDVAAAQDFDQLLSQVTGDVILKLQTKDLTYAVTTKPLAVQGLPWLKEVLLRLEGDNLNNADIVEVSTFVTCVALLHNGRYVDYARLAQLHQKLPLSQHRLQQLQILDSTIMAGFRLFKLYTLHSDIPYKVNFQPKLPKQTEWKADDEQPQDVGQDDHITQEGDENLVHTQPMQLPFNYKSPWSDKELQFWQQSRAEDIVSVHNGYEIFCKICHFNRIPCRSFQAYKRRCCRK